MPRVASGELQASYCLSEPDAGSDVAGMSTRAVRDGDHYVLQRHEGVDHERGRQRPLHRVRQDRPRRRAPRDQRVRGREGHARALDRQARVKMGMRGSPTGELLLDDAQVPGREPHRRGGQGLHVRDGCARLVPAARRRAGARHRAGRARRRHALRRRAPPVRPAHRRLPGRAVHARRHGDPGGGGAAARLPGVHAARRR